MRQKTKDRIKKRAKKKGWTDEQLIAALERKEEKIEKRKEVFATIGGVVKLAAKTVVGATPGGAVIGNAISRVPVLNAAPGIKQIADEARETVEKQMDAGKQAVAVVAQDIIPAVEAFKSGNYVQGIIQVAIFGLTLYLIVRQFI